MIFCNKKGYKPYKDSQPLVYTPPLTACLLYTSTRKYMKFIVSSTALSSHLQAISRVINSKMRCQFSIVSSSNWKTELCL